ncbi:hypothetical protein AMATHDRAFT_49106 [Amanita thiersii Skay4041]|uniref:AB hydrolase-1 domain-containing protein n=1 Tax=Amanita thiersii Skay4041 TaxID=703135 RepID=A0A2A9NML5_9AGAR|nr:hypothetical protein AMATHDRAFT_49106 [Amanita thiersii Skay4041]
MSSLSLPATGLVVDKFEVTTTTHGFPLKSLCNRYTRSGSLTAKSSPKITLIFAHGSGFHKECWEPTLERLFEMDARSRFPMIREAWALDAQHHGESAIVNEGALVENQGVTNITDYGAAIAALCKSPFFGPIDPTYHQVIVVGHSLGTVAVLLSTTHFQNIPYTSLILIDTVIHSDEMKLDTETFNVVRDTTPSRKDHWDSIESARRYMRTRIPYKSWDPHVFSLFLRYGLRPLPTAYYPDSSRKGVTLSTHRNDEHASYTYFHMLHEAYHRLNEISDTLPIHLIYAARSDMMQVFCSISLTPTNINVSLPRQLNSDRAAQEKLYDPKEGRKFASITRLGIGGHLIVQEAPDLVAHVIHEALTGRAEKYAYKL